MRISHSEPRFLLAALGAAALACSGPARAQDADTSGAEAMDLLDSQLDRAPSDEPEPNTELWEEYKKYQRKDEDDLRHSAERVEIGGSVVVREGDLIEGDAVAVGGSVTVFGQVEGDCVAIGGDVILQEGALIEGDAVSIGGKVREIGPAEVLGERVSVDLGVHFGEWFRGWDGDRTIKLGASRWVSFSFDIAFLIVALLIAFLLYAVAGRRLDVVARRIDDEPGQSFLIGLLGAFATPFAFFVTTILLIITLIGILLIPVLVILVAAMMIAGFVAVSLTVGRRITQARSRSGALQPARGPYFHILVGFVALFALGLLSSLMDLGGHLLGPLSVLFGLLGFFVLVFAGILGYGALMTSRFGTQPSGIAAMTPPPVPPAPPVPPPPAPAPPAPDSPGDAGDTPPDSDEEKPSA